MNRFESFNIKKRRSTVLAVLKYDDCFFDAALRKYDFNEALHVYLKNNGYETIVFFSKAEGFFSYEEKMLNDFLNKKEGSQNPTQATFERADIVDELTGLDLLSFANDSTTLCDSSRRHLIKTFNFWQEHTIGAPDSQKVDMVEGLKRVDNCVIIIDPSADEFPDSIFEGLISYLKLGSIKSENHLVVLVPKDMHLERIPENMLRSRSVFFSNPYFREQFLTEKNNRSGSISYELKPSTTFVIPPPTALDIKNEFQYLRYVEDFSPSIDWYVIDDIFSQLSVNRGEETEQKTHSLKVWNDYFKELEEISIDTLKSFGVHKIDNSKTVKFDKDKLANDLKAVKGQEDNIKVVIDDINTWIRKKKKSRPLVFMFAGTSGTGKTFTAKQIAKSLKGDGYEYIRLDMNQYKNEGDVWKLQGSATGYSGSETDAPLFVARKRSDRLVILLDEIEKAHPSLFTTIMSLMDEGQFANGKGENYDFSQSVIIFTTNLAMEKLLQTKESLSSSKIDTSSNEFQEKTKRILKDNKIPHEICGRIRRLLVYNSLSESDIVQIALEYIRRKAKDEYELNINLVSNSYLTKIAEQCAGSTEGARPVINSVDTDIEPILQNAVDNGMFPPDEFYNIDDNMQLVRVVIN